MEQTIDIIKFLKKSPELLSNALPFKDTISLNEVKKIEDDIKHLEKNGDLQKAFELQKELLLNNPTNVEYFKKAAVICKKNNLNIEALSFIEKYLTIVKDDPKANYEKAILLKRLGKIDQEYEASLNLVIKRGDVNLKDKAIHALIDHSWYHKGQSPQSIDLIRLVSKKEVTNPIRLQKYASILLQSGRPNEAIAYYEKSVRIDIKYKNYCPFIALGAFMYKHDSTKYPKLKKYKIANDYLNKYRNKFIEEVSNNSYALVGNSPCEKGLDKGEEIDKNRHVIRFNNFSSNLKFSKDYGSKSTIWVKPGGFFDEVKERDLCDIELVVLGKPDIEYCHTDAVDHILYFKEKNVPVCTIPRNVYNEAFSELEGIPSMGALMTSWIYHYLGDISSNNLFGFSMTDQKNNKNSHYFKDIYKRNYYKHDWDKERKMLDSFLKVA